jgi:putative phosphoribosyl transferase
MSLFKNRRQAGELLGRSLRTLPALQDVTDIQVIGLPRGGVPVGYEVAQKIGTGLDVLIVRKLGVPGHEELAMGAIASGGIQVLNRDVVDSLSISEKEIEQVALQEEREIFRRNSLYRDGKPRINVRGKVVILVDDGLATGSTMRAAVRTLRNDQPKLLIVAVPVAPASTCQQLRRDVDELVCLHTPENFLSVGLWYDEFEQTSDEEVRELLQSAKTLPKPVESSRSEVISTKNIPSAELPV